MGGDSALECAIALAGSGAKVTVSYRKAGVCPPEAGERREAQNAGARSESERAGGATKLRAGDDRVHERDDAGRTARVGHARAGDDGDAHRAGQSDPAEGQTEREVALPNDAVFSMIGREAPLEFFRRSGLHVRGDWRPITWISCLAFVLFCVVLYHWKSNHPQEFPVQRWVSQHHAFPLQRAESDRCDRWKDRRMVEPRRRTCSITIKRGLGNPSFYYTLAYCTCVFVFGIRRIRRRRTPYVKWQTIVLICSQCIPLFILPEIILPWMGHNGFFETGHPLRWLADHLFESYDGSLGHERAYWRAYGFILAFPLNVYNVFTDHPMWLWLGICFRPDLCHYPADYFPLGQGRLLRLDLLLWRARRDDGRYATARKCRTDPSGIGSTWSDRPCSSSPLPSSVCVSPAGRSAKSHGPTHWYHKLFEGIPFPQLRLER